MTGSLSQTRGRPEPGRELDAIIAETLFGALWWRSSVSGRRALFIEKPPEWFTERANGTESRVGDWATYGGFQPYSANIAAAWQIVETMVARGYDVSVMCESDGRISCEMAKPAWRGSEVESAHTVPHAICLAALAALSPADDGGAR